MGESFAYMQIKTILSVLLNEYDMTPVGDFPKANLEGMVVGPIGPTMMKFKRKVPLSAQELEELKDKGLRAKAKAASNKPVRVAHTKHEASIFFWQLALDLPHCFQ